MGAASHEIVLFRLLAAVLTPDPRERPSNACGCAWEEEVYPLFDEAAEMHKPFPVNLQLASRQ